MGSDTLRSPQVIPPRTSSTIGTMTTNGGPRASLRVVPEGDWISQGKKGHQHTSSLGGGGGGGGVSVGPESQGNNNRGHSHSTSIGIDSQGKKSHSHSLSLSGTGGTGGGSDPSRHISDDLIYQSRSTWSPEKEKVRENGNDLNSRWDSSDHADIIYFAFSGDPSGTVRLPIRASWKGFSKSTGCSVQCMAKGSVGKFVHHHQGSGHAPYRFIIVCGWVR